MVNTLKKTNKKLYLKFDVLNMEFLRKIKDENCKVLHLSPHMFSSQNNQIKMIVEDDKVGQVHLSP